MGLYFEISSIDLKHYKYFKEAIDESGSLNQRYRGKIIGVKSSELQKCIGSKKNLQKKVNSY